MASQQKLNPEEQAQLEFYASMSGMTVPEYLAASGKVPQQQAPTTANEAGLRPDQVVATRKQYQDEIDQIWKDAGKYPPTPEQEAIAMRGTGPKQKRIQQLTKAGEALDREERFGPNMTGGPGSVGAQDAAISTALTGYGTQSNDLNAKNRKVQEDYFSNTVTPALGAQQSAVANQQSANRLAEAQLRSGGTALNSSLAATQGQRNAGINSANAAQTQALGNLTGQLNAANSAQSAANSTLAGQNSRMNQQQDVANRDLSNTLAYQTADGNNFTATHGNDLDQLNIQDEDSLANYLGEMDPLKAAQIARASDPKYVQQQQDVYDKYKELSNPEVTAQERFLAEMVRRKFEGDDKSSRDAQYAALKSRGLNSGGQQIAAQLASRQAQGSERVLGELGLSASAQQRAMGAIAGQGGVAEQLRNADDKMRNFQDTYAQNDSIRRQSVIQGQENTQMANTAQRGTRVNDKFDAQRANLNDATNRSGMTFDAATTTNNANTGRNQSTFNAATTTNDANTGRNVSGYNAATGTNEANFGRSSYGWDTGDRNAATAYGTVKDQTSTSISNRAGEVGSAQGLTGSSIAAAGTQSTMQNGLTRAQQDALDRMLDNTIVSNTTKPKDAKNV